VDRTKGWPGTLSEPDLLDAPLVLHPMRPADSRALRELRDQNPAWLSWWEYTDPGQLQAGQPAAKQSASLLSRGASFLQARLDARSGTAFHWAVRYSEQVVGQVSVLEILWGASRRCARIGYWVAEPWAGRGIIPASVAMVVDHCFLDMGLHRLEACIDPDNAASLRVAEKLGFHSEGIRFRDTHINGAWRNHICYAITAEEYPEGMLSRLRAVSAARSRLSR
jgi:ribosomal-protein-alanine N-acetyltransferase